MHDVRTTVNSRQRNRVQGRRAVEQRRRTV